MSAKLYEKCLDWIDDFLESSAAYTVDLKNRTALKAFRELRATAAKQERELAEAAATIERLTAERNELIEVGAVTLTCLDTLAARVNDDDLADYVAEVASRLETVLRKLGQEPPYEWEGK